jgi:hypothetical protein
VVTPPLWAIWAGLIALILVLSVPHAGPRRL